MVGMGGRRAGGARGQTTVRVRVARGQVGGVGRGWTRPRAVLLGG